ncbi:MAG: hypothetical protein EOO39_07235 [Cytophagaceae bacterium]|nr:MAG: hypothetical protein EOO39_07235 [Cytophagaceae bacterium]
MAQLLLPPPMGVIIRMYRSGGLGDCFLLAFAGSGESPCYVLVDCGVFFGTEGAQQRMQQIASDIEAVTGGRLDILVATHEHWDHLAGFSFAQDVFERISIGEVWVAWTEDPQNPIANQLRQSRQQALQALWAVTQRLQASHDQRADALAEVLSFHGAFSARTSASTAEQMRFVQSLGPVRYCRPGHPLGSLPNASQVRVYVLGPPEDEVLLKRSNPRRGQVYEQNSNPLFADQLASLRSGGFYSAALGEGSSSESPFNQQFVLPLAKLKESLQPVEHVNFFREHYGFTDGLDEGRAWRRIDTDWLGAAEHLALDLDNDTNNTSLVLAFELPSGKVLLFPGDAQAGNWLSWADVRWQLNGKVISGLDLLRNVAVYKVGHHGSHNATLSMHGLELMERDDLVALLPVDEAQARHKRWAMPFGPLYERLQTKTKGRILRADTGIPTQPDEVSVKQWQLFLDQVRKDSSSEQLWIELCITD